MTKLDLLSQHSNNSLDREQLNRTLINSLQRNASLRILRFGLWNGLWDDQYVNFDWSSVSNLLCDTSGIDATSRSNHKLESIFVTGVPIAINNILHMNRNGNKRAVIREKILKNHNLDQVNFVRASLPVVFCWPGDVHVEHTLGLSQLVRILCTVPHMIRHKVDETRGVKRNRD
jgi:hypothetical protein